MRVQSPITYLACPYTPLPDTPEDQRAAIMESRFSLVTLISAFLISKGYVVFSPITHSHVIQQHPLNTFTQNTQEQWVWGQDIHFVHLSKELWIIKYDQWDATTVQKSKGVKAERREANIYNIPIQYLKVQLRTTGTEDYLRLQLTGILTGIYDNLINKFLGSIPLPPNTPLFL